MERDDSSRLVGMLQDLFDCRDDKSVDGYPSAGSSRTMGVSLP